jgi:chromosome segregation ATPase
MGDFGDLALATKNETADASFVREKYNQARKLYEAAKPHNKRASRVYYALYTLLYTSICATKTEMLDKYVRTKGPLLPAADFDLDEWEPALRAALRSRSAELEAAQLRVEDDRRELQGRLAAAAAALRQQRGAVAAVNAAVAHDVDAMKQELAQTHRQIAQAVARFAQQQTQMQAAGLAAAAATAAATAPAAEHAQAVVAVTAQITALMSKMEQLQREADDARRAGSAEAAASAAEARDARLALDTARRQMLEDARAAQERLSVAEARGAALAASLARCEQALAGQAAGNADAAATTAVDALLAEKAVLASQAAALEEALRAREADARALTAKVAEAEAAVAPAAVAEAVAAAAAAAAEAKGKESATVSAAQLLSASEQEVDALRKQLQMATHQLRSALAVIGRMKVDLESTRDAAASLEQEVTALRAGKAAVASAAAPAPRSFVRSLSDEFDVASPRLSDRKDSKTSGKSNDGTAAATGPPASGTQNDALQVQMQALKARNVGLERQVKSLTGQLKDAEARCRALERERDAFAEIVRARTPNRTPPPELAGGGGSPARRALNVSSLLGGGAGPTGLDRLRPLYGSSDFFSLELEAFEQKKAGRTAGGLGLGRSLVLPAARGVNANNGPVNR